MRPSKDEELAWRRTLDPGYTSFTPTYRPTQLAQGLGLGVCEHIGVFGKASPVRGTFEGFGIVGVLRKYQLVLHGPMLYVDSPYQCIDEAKPAWERSSAMIFLNSREQDYPARKDHLRAVEDDIV